MKHRMCDACGMYRAIWSNPMLGTDDALCKACFEDWYEAGIVYKAEMKARRQAELKEINNGTPGI